MYEWCWRCEHCSCPRGPCVADGYEGDKDGPAAAAAAAGKTRSSCEEDRGGVGQDDMGDRDGMMMGADESGECGDVGGKKVGRIGAGGWGGENEKDQRTQGSARWKLQWICLWQSLKQKQRWHDDVLPEPDAGTIRIAFAIAATAVRNTAEMQTHQHCGEAGDGSDPRILSVCLDAAAVHKQRWARHNLRGSAWCASWTGWCLDGDAPGDRGLKQQICYFFDSQ